MASEQEMMADLATADAAGDTALAQHIAGQIKALKAPPPPVHGRIAEALHKTASYLPMAGGIAGGALGAGAGAPTGIGSVLLGALGAGALGGAGKGIQHLIDQKLGYEQPMGIMDAAKDTGKAAAGEALGAGAGSLAGEGLAAGARWLSPAMRDAAVATTRRILRNTGGSLSTAKPLSGEAAQEVLDMGIIKPFGTSAGAATRLEAARAAAGDQYGKILQALEARGIAGPDAQALAQQLSAEGHAVSAGGSMNQAVPNVYESAATMTAAKPTVGGRLGLTQAETMKRSLQDQARSAYKQMQPGELAQAHENAASMMRQSVEDEIAKQAAASGSPETRAIAAQFEPVKQQVSRLIEASNLSRTGMARASNRRFVSPFDVVAATGELAHSGSPLRAAAAAAAAHALSSRGPSTVASGLNFAANRLEDPASNILAQLGAGAGAVKGPTLLDLIASLRKRSSTAQQEPTIASR